MSKIWKNLIDKSIEQLNRVNTANIEQNNISREAITDVLNDNPEEIPDDIENEDEESSNNDMDGDFGGDSGDESDGSDDTGMNDGDDFGADEEQAPEPKTIKKNEFANVNNKILIIERYDRLLETAHRAQELFKKIPEIREVLGDQLQSLIQMIEDEKGSVALYNKAENNIRYRMYFERLNKVLNSILKHDATVKSSKET